MKKLILLFLLTTHLFANYGANMQMMTAYAMTVDNNSHKQGITIHKELTETEQARIVMRLIIGFSILMAGIILLNLYFHFTKPVPKYINGKINPKWFSRNSLGSTFRS
jgi:hypothetical protein